MAHHVLRRFPTTPIGRRWHNHHRFVFPNTAQDAANSIECIFQNAGYPFVIFGLVTISSKSHRPYDRTASFNSFWLDEPLRGDPQSPMIVVDVILSLVWKLVCDGCVKFDVCRCCNPYNYFSFYHAQRVSTIDWFVPKFSKGSALRGGWEDRLSIWSLVF
jgi:hypothetical protein